MEADVLGALGGAFEILLQPRILFYILLGTLLGTLLAAIPGVGGLLGVALLLPFTFSMSPHEAVAFLLGALAVLSTADTIPAILFGVPGTPTSMATVLDGYPMAQRGEAGRALGAAFMSSILGGILGVLPLILIIPLIMPILLGATSPELFAICVMGMAMVAALSGDSMYKGLAAACIGILIALIGQDSQTAVMRWTFGQTYLWDGINVLVMVLGIYALPELADLAIQNRAVAKKGVATNPMRGAMTGVRDSFRHFGIVARSSGISTVLGILPAIGAAVIPWIVYSYTVATTRGPNEFGKGDVRGVIATESSNNATVGGSLLPTVALGIPGSAPMALLLAAFLMHGVAPGPDMLTRNLDFTFMMVWTIALANVIGGVLAFLLSVQLSRIVYLRSTILVPGILAVVFIGAVQSSRLWEDLVALFFIGFLGWIMKRARWPRAPFLLAFILAPLVERYFFISMRIHDWQFVYRPVVAILLLGTLLFLVFVGIRAAMKARARRKGRPGNSFAPVFTIEANVAIATGIICSAAFVTAAGWQPAARAIPQIAAMIGLAMSVGALLAVWLKPGTLIVADATSAQSNSVGAQDAEADAHYDVSTDFGDLTSREIYVRGAKYFALLCLYFGLCWLVGVLAATPVFLLIYMVVNKEPVRLSLILAVSLGLGFFLIFDTVLNLPWPVPVWDGADWLRDVIGFVRRGLLHSFD